MQFFYASGSQTAGRDAVPEGDIRLWQKIIFNVKFNWNVQFILAAFSHLFCKQPFNLLIPYLKKEIWAIRFQRLLALFIAKPREATGIFILKI
jgi:hypothetical protein